MTDFKQSFTGPGTITVTTMEGPTVVQVPAGTGATVEGKHDSSGTASGEAEPVEHGRFYPYIYRSHPPALDALTKPPHNYTAGALQIVPDDAFPDDPSMPAARGGRSRTWAVLDPGQPPIAPDNWKIRGEAR